MKRAMQPAARRDQIVRIVEEAGEATVEALADRFGASRETIRRDLTLLDSRGHLRKYHGGARRRDLPALVEGRFDARLTENTAAKGDIARTAAALFRPGATLFMDMGTTTVAFARALAARRDLGPGVTVITNSVEGAAMLAQAERGHRVFLVGGEMSGDGRETLGMLAITQIGQFRAEHVVLTVGALNHDGILDYDLREAEMARAMLAQGEKLTVLADHTKLSRAAVFSVAGLSRIDRLVTDRPPRADLAAALAAAGVEVILADG